MVEKISFENVDICGTCFHGVTFNVSVNDIIKVLGQPTYDVRDDGEKTQVEWDMNVIIDGKPHPIAVYDWKEYRVYDNDEDIKWNVGGLGDGSENEFAYYLLEQLEKLWQDEFAKEKEAAAAEKNAKYVLVSTNDESMNIDNETFDTLAEAQAKMREEWEGEDGDEEEGDYCREMEALICGTYVYLWKIIKVTF